MADSSAQLHLTHVHNLSTFIHRSHTFLHSIALSFLLLYRASFFFLQHSKKTPTLPWLLIFSSELILSFTWLLGRAFRWRPISRTVFPERLSGDDILPAIDVFICTADPEKEPTVEVMNTVLSAMAMDYPPEKLHVYVSDDGGSWLTLNGMREAWRFGRWWIPFCRKYGVKMRCPKAFFSGSEVDCGYSLSSEFEAERLKIQKKYNMFKESVTKARKNGGFKDTSMSPDHPALIEVMDKNCVEGSHVKMPLLVYVSREKRPSHSHHFKAGALNVLLRVSGMMSNSPYILVLDCDMYCNDPSSARQAMCFYLQPNIYSSLAFVQFPQRFHNISKNDIYDAQLRSIFSIMWEGADGLEGPCVSGTCFYMNRVSLFGSFIQEGNDLVKIKQCFGESNEFIKSLRQSYKPNGISSSEALLPQETQLLASCTYEDDTKWGKEVGFLYYSVIEDYFTSLVSLHCKGWKSVYCNPKKPQFLGSATTNLNDLLVQGTRWCTGLLEVGISKFSPLIYGSFRMSLLQSMWYADLAFTPLSFLPLGCFAIIPQLCLLNRITLYPQVSSSYFIIFSFIFLSAHLKHLHEVIITGGSIQTWANEQRIWMIKSVTCHLYGSLDAIMKKIGIKEASFLPTNKVADNEKAKRYEMGIFDFQTSPMFLVPMVTVIILNLASFLVGISRMITEGIWDEMFAQVFVSAYILIMNYPVIEGAVVRKDKGCIPLSITLLSAMFSMIILFLGSIVLTA